MADIFNTQGNKATQAVIDAASKILMGVKDDETAKAQTEEEHPAIDPKNQELDEAKKAKLDAPGEEDGDIDNDGDSDQSDAFLAKKRKAIKKAMATEGVELPDYVIEAIEEVLAEDPDFQLDEALPLVPVAIGAIARRGAGGMGGGVVKKAQAGARKAIKKVAKKIASHMKKEGIELPDYVYESMAEALSESEDLDADSASKALDHDCAKHVVHKEHGEGQCVPGMHTLEENEDGTGYVTHYDVMFGDTIVEDVPVEELEIVSEMHHGHPMKKKKKK